MARMRRLTFVLFASIALVPALWAQTSRAPHFDSISADEMRADLFFLASDGMQGRLTNTPHNDLAADWVRSRFERLGLRPGGHSGSFDHRYALMTATLGTGNELSFVDRSLGTPAATSTVRAQLRPGIDFYPHRSSASATVDAPLTFAGFGIVSTERGHDD